MVETAAANSGADEAQLLARLRANDADAFESLVRQFGARLLATARRFLANEEDAKDALQEAFISAFRGLGSFEGGSRLSTWLHRIVVNAALMRLRRRKRQPEQSIEALLPTYLPDGHATARATDWSEPAHEAMQRGETRALVRACIDQLPDTYRTVLLLRDIEGMDTQDTATILEIEPNAVKVRLHRARQALRTLLDRHFGAEAV